MRTVLPTDAGSLATLLRRTDLHGRLVYGSDYPLPAINAVISTQLLVRLGYLREARPAPLREIYHKNRSCSTSCSSEP